MNIETLKIAKAEAKKFIDRCEDIEDSITKSEKNDVDYLGKKRYENYDKAAENYLMYGSPETSALKRQSMELTRSLSKLRKPF